MCIYFIFSKIQSLCACHPEGIFCPSIQERENFCFANFKDCTYFTAKINNNAQQNQKGGDYVGEELNSQAT
jgi:hypothetical protein